MSDLAGVCCFFNPCGYKKLRMNYDQFRSHWDRAGLKLLTVELLYDGQQTHFAGVDNVLTLSGGDVLWQKERLLQIGLDILRDEGHANIAWVDADLDFEESNWDARVLRSLEEFDCVHMFETQVTHFSDVTYVRSSVVKDHKDYVYGGGWAGTAKYWEQVALYQHAILGSGDYVMAMGMLGLPIRSTAGEINSRIQAHTESWAAALPTRKIGFVQGQTAHLLPHGKEYRRNYTTRSSYLVDFDPLTDVVLSPGGAWQWATDKPELHRAVNKYFELRREDD